VLSAGVFGPRKVRQFKSDLRHEGFSEVRERGKGSHSFWRHRAFANLTANMSGHDGDDAWDYQEQQARSAITEAARRER
jgi:predicted RNA binding protein YcfA (HicA-like mRNA interferase family)